MTNDQAPMTKTVKTSIVGHWDLIIGDSFVIRASSFVIDLKSPSAQAH